MLHQQGGSQFPKCTRDLGFTVFLEPTRRETQGYVPRTIRLQLAIAHTGSVKQVAQGGER